MASRRLLGGWTSRQGQLSVFLMKSSSFSDHFSVLFHFLLMDFFLLLKKFVWDTLNGDKDGFPLSLFNLVVYGMID